MAFLPEKRSERLKFVVLVVGFIAFVAVGYFRFFYKKPPKAAAKVSPAISLEQLQVPRVDIEMPSKTQTPDTPGIEALSGFMRDIFSPFTSTTSSTGPSGQQPSGGSSSTLVLMGTITGGGKPMAIINDQFVARGDQIGKYRVIRIKKNEVLLDSGGRQIKLEIVDNE